MGVARADDPFINLLDRIRKIAHLDYLNALMLEKFCTEAMDECWWLSEGENDSADAGFKDQFGACAWA